MFFGYSVKNPFQYNPNISYKYYYEKCYKKVTCNIISIYNKFIIRICKYTKNYINANNSTIKFSNSIY